MTPPSGAPLAVEQVPSVGRFQLAIVVSLLGLFGFLTVGLAVQFMSIPFGLWFTEVFIFFAVPFVALRLSGREPIVSAGLSGPWVAGLAFGVALGTANFFCGAMPLMYLSQKLVPHEWLEIFDSSVVFRDKGPLELLAVVSGVCLAAPICEEYFFRGVLQPGLMARTNPARAVVLTALWFSFCHLDPIGFLARWELGIVFGLLAWRTGSIWPGIGAHLANNLVSTVLFLATRDQPDEASNELAQLAGAVGIGALGLGLAFLASRRWPALLTAPRPMLDTLQPAPSPTRAIGPWLLAGIASVAVLLALDWRGVGINMIDALAPVRAPKKTAPPADVERYAALRAKRALAHDGQLPLREYFQLRKDASPMLRARLKKSSAPAE